MLICFNLFENVEGTIINLFIMEKGEVNLIIKNRSHRSILPFIKQRYRRKINDLSKSSENILPIYIHTVLQATISITQMIFQQTNIYLNERQSYHFTYCTKFMKIIIQVHLF